MTKYARIKEGYLIDVWRVPEDYSDIATRDRCLGTEGWIAVPDATEHGAKVIGEDVYENPVQINQTPGEQGVTDILRVMVRLQAIEAKIEALTPSEP